MAVTLQDCPVFKTGQVLNQKIRKFERLEYKYLNILFQIFFVSQVGKRAYRSDPNQRLCARLPAPLRIFDDFRLINILAKIIPKIAI